MKILRQGSSLLMKHLPHDFHETGINTETLARPSAEAFARIAYGKFLAGFRADVATLDANYLRRSDAEIFSSPKAAPWPPA